MLLLTVLATPLPARAKEELMVAAGQFAQISPSRQNYLTLAKHGNSTNRTGEVSGEQVSTAGSFS